MEITSIRMNKEFTEIGFVVAEVQDRNFVLGVGAELDAKVVAVQDVDTRLQDRHARKTCDDAIAKCWVS